jgi:hypothetical protein
VRRGRCAAALAVFLAIAARAEAAPAAAEIRTSDVTLFYRLYDAAHGAPSAETLQHDYIDAGSPGVRQFVPQRILSGEALAKKIGANPALYERARSCMTVLPAVKQRLRGAFRKLAVLDPEATFPPVTVLVGRGNSGGTTGKSGVLIGLETICSADWLQPDPADRLTHLIAHEYVHVQQFPQGGEDAAPDTVLRQSLVEGGPEFIAELTSGQASEAYLQTWTRGRGKEIGEAFLKDQDSTDLKPWLYNGHGAPEHPGDLGYWIGYEICRGYYRQAGDKRAAIHDMLTLADPKALLVKSGWTPGDHQP